MTVIFYNIYDPSHVLSPARPQKSVKINSIENWSKKIPLEPLIKLTYSIKYFSEFLLSFFDFNCDTCFLNGLSIMPCYTKLLKIYAEIASRLCLL